MRVYSIRLTNSSKVFIVDRNLYRLANLRKWYLKTGKTGMSIYSTDTPQVNVTAFLFGAPGKGNRWDHIDRNVFNNLKSNLRIATHRQNNYNRSPLRNNTSGYKGVTWDREKHKWRAQIGARGKMRYIGRFSSKQKAAKAYNIAALRLHGRFASLNRLEVE